jgi:hypothetical protein
MVGVAVLVDVGVAVGDRNGAELQLIEIRKKADRPSTIAWNEINLLFIIWSPLSDLFYLPNGSTQGRGYLANCATSRLFYLIFY